MKSKLAIPMVFMLCCLSNCGIIRSCTGCGADKEEPEPELAPTPANLSASQTEPEVRAPSKKELQESLFLENPSAREQVSEIRKLLELKFWYSAQLRINALPGGIGLLPAFQDEWDRVSVGMKKHDFPTPADVPEEQRLLLARAGLSDAATVVGSKEDCQDPLRTMAAFERLKLFTAKDSEWRKARAAARKLDGCRKRALNALVQTAERFAESQRERYASSLDTNFLKDGLDVRVEVKGKSKTQLYLRWPGFNRVSANQLANEGGLARDAKRLGFVRVTFSDGFSESFHFDVDSEWTNATTTIGQGLGIDLPIELK